MEFKLNWKKYFTFLLAGVFGIIIFAQHYCIMLHSEDFLVIGASKLGIMQLIQSVIVILICCFSGGIAAEAAGYDRKKCIVLLLIMYGLIDAQTLNDGVYYYSVSIYELWPLLPFLAGVYFLIKFEKSGAKKYQMAVPVLFSASSFYNDRIAAMALFFLLIHTFFRCRQEKKTSKYLLALNVIATACLVSAVVVSRSRLEPQLYAEFYTKGILERIAGNILPVMRVNIGRDNLLLTVLLTLAGGGAAYLYFKREILLEFSILFSAFFFMDQIFEIPMTVSDTVRIIWFVIYFILFIVYYMKRKQYLLFSLLISGCSSQGVLLRYPDIMPRFHIVMVIILQILTGAFITDILASHEKDVSSWKKIRNRSCMLMFILLSFCILLHNVYVYRGNRMGYELEEGNWYTDSWLGESATISFTSGAEQTVIVSLTNAGNVEDMEVSCLYQGKEEVYKILPSETCRFEIDLTEGTSIMVLEASEVFVPANGDVRNLSVLLDIENG